MSLLGLDIGSSAMKGVAFGADGDAIAQAQAPYAVHSPRPGWLEADGDDIWNAFVGVVRRIGHGTDRDPVEALALSCHGETLVLRDGEGRTLGGAIMNADNRAFEESDQIQAIIGWEAEYRISGVPPHAMFPLAKLAWLRKHERHVLDAAAQVHCLADFLLARLDLPRVIDPSLAGRTQLFDVHAGNWSAPLSEVVGLDTSRLAEVQPAGALVGALDQSQAALLGLPAGVKIVNGGHDQTCGALGLGVVEPGLMGDSAGSYECLTVSGPSPVLGPAAIECRLNCYSHVVPGQYVTLAFFPSGVMVNWFVETLCGVGKADQGRWYQELESSAEIEPSGLAVYPHLVGACHPQWNAQARAHILGLTLNSTRATIYRGILEGLAAEFANNHQILSSLFPAAVREVRVFGGGASSLLGLRLRAAAAGTRVRQARSREASCLGAAILAGVGSGTFASIREALAHQLDFQEPIEPEPALAAWFEEYRTRYNRQFETLLGLIGERPHQQ